MLWGLYPRLLPGASGQNALVNDETSLIHGRVLPYGKKEFPALISRKEVIGLSGQICQPAGDVKRKANHAFTITPGSRQRHLDWRRLGRLIIGHYHCGSISPLTAERVTMPRDYKSSDTDTQKRPAVHIGTGYEKKGVSLKIPEAPLGRPIKCPALHLTGLTRLRWSRATKRRFVSLSWSTTLQYPDLKTSKMPPALRGHLRMAEEFKTRLDTSADSGPVLA